MTINTNINTISATLILFLFCMICTIYSSAVVAGYSVAGTAPWQRPVDAPFIEFVQHDHKWYEKALVGVDAPYPRSLYFLDNQGNWYTPFTSPGMVGPYDIRKWHK